jgi:hypothetical protein
MQEFRDMLRNEHLNRFAGLFAIAISPGWRMRHPEVASVRGRLDQIARIVRGGEVFDTWSFLAEFMKLLTDIVHADPHLSYTEEDLDWLMETLDAGFQHARTTIMLLLAVASGNPRWYTAEELSEITGLSQITWRKRAAEDPEWMAQKRGKLWLFHEIVLRAHGVAVPQSMQIEVEEVSSENEE